MRQGWTLPPFLEKRLLQLLATATRQEKEINGLQYV
jgi:hypothetical protein